ncbi:hypothetical protein DFH07DRAFT_763638 [Mycena maculata]|uniref:Uncharacterized protein n=1 Tax=Mycena maculata TaxID=230809 RepID=A0AAD7P2M1_9AGAR|nr:hypothetical protein DFH07DRAFT_763638 [Mycena maculata]
MCLQLFSHRCWQYRPHLEVLFHGRELCMALEDYLRMFLLSVGDAPRITRMSISSVAYCCTCGANAYPFLIVHLDDPEVNDFSVRMKLQGFDGPMAVGLNPVKLRHDEGGKTSTLSVAHVRESVRQLVGTKRYDVIHTATFRWDITEAGLFEPSIVDLLAVAGLSTKWDSSREGYPAALFLALNTLFNAVATSYSKAACDAAPEMKSAILDAFPARRQRLEIDIDLQCRARQYMGFPNSDIVEINELRALNAGLVAQVAHLQGTIDHLMEPVCSPRGIDPSEAMVVG